MTNVDFEYVLLHIDLPLGRLLSDGKTYRLKKRDFSRLDPISRVLLRLHYKMLALSDGQGHVVGGVLFYGPHDLQALMLEPYRGRGFMSAIHRNGILRRELEKNQDVSISIEDLKSWEDFEMKCHLLSLIGLKSRDEDYIRREFPRYMWEDESDEEGDDCDE